ncbi:MAG: hypothetical protein ACRC5W_09365 [Cetobacterium sp.]|uniref:hypothetical protein n=1 Tax=Cetobacterium sp. TaxID=2071632 RepID=UPI003F3FEA21
MKKFLLLLCLIQILGCNVSSKNSLKVEKKSEFIETSAEIKKIEEDINTFYKDVKDVQYRFNGDYSKEVVPYIVGKNLIIPITPSKIRDSDYLSIGVLIDLENKTEKVLLDGLKIDYSEFKKIVDIGNEWANKTSNFEATHILEIPIVEKIDIEFPQSDKAKSFRAVMIFSEGTRDRNVLLREIGEGDSLINISLKRDHLMHLAEGLSPLYIKGALNQSSSTIQKELESLKIQYNELKMILK